MFSAVHFYQNQVFQKARVVRVYLVCFVKVDQRGIKLVKLLAIDLGGLALHMQGGLVRLGGLAGDGVLGHGLGQAMLMEALRACLRAADVIGVRAVLVHAKDESTRDFYKRYGFMASPTHPLHVIE